MRLSTVLFQQHIGRKFREHWKVQGKKIIRDNGSIKACNEKGIQLVSPFDIINEKRPIQPVKLDRPSLFEKLEFNESHPDYHETQCSLYSDNNVLLDGLKQAQALTNSVLVDSDFLPVNKAILLDENLLLQDKLVKRCIKSSMLFDAVQEKLPKRINPEKEAYNYPREYGIPDTRINELIVMRLLKLCAYYSPQLFGDRMKFESLTFTLPVNFPSGERVLFSIKANDVIVASKNPSTGSTGELSDLKVPVIHPLLPTVSLQHTHFYKFDPFFPLREDLPKNKIHTVFLHYNKSQVANLYDVPVTTDQILGRSLVQSWVIAMCQAKALQKSTEEFEPVTIQTIQTDGQFYHFSAFKLSSTSLESGAPPNYFWSYPVMNMFETCAYVKGVPVLEGYDSRVFKTILAFYNNT